MNEPAELDALIDAACAVLGIPLVPAYRAGVRLHLAISLDHARAVAAFALPDAAEPAPVFRA